MYLIRIHTKREVEARGSGVSLSYKKLGFAITGAKNIRAGVNSNGPMFFLQMSRALVQVFLNVFAYGECQKHKIIPRICGT